MADTPQMPEPRLWVSADLIEDPLNQHDNSILGYQCEQDVHPLDQPAAPLFTAAQMHAFRAEGVQEALELAAKLCETEADGEAFAGNTQAERAADDCAKVIRALAAEIHPPQKEDTK